MTEMNLAARVRPGKGKSVARRLRRDGRLPAIVYGVGEPVPIDCNAREAEQLVHTLHGSERLISLQIEDGGAAAQQRHVLLKSVQEAPVGHSLLHIDFHEVDVTKAVHVSVEVHTEGRPVGEKDGGTLQQVTYEVFIECLPTLIPERLTLDVAGLRIGESLHVKDLVVPEGVKVVSPADETLCVVAAPRVEDEGGAVAAGAEPVEGEAAAAPAEEKAPGAEKD